MTYFTFRILAGLVVLVLIFIVIDLIQQVIALIKKGIFNLIEIWKCRKLRKEQIKSEAKK